MEFLGFKIDSNILLANPLFLNLFLIVSLLAIIKLSFGKEIASITSSTWSKIRNRDKKKNIGDWTAVCKDRVGWVQKADGYALELENKHLKKLSFEVSPVGEPENWRAGFILGNSFYHPQKIIDTENSLLFHAGAPPPIDEAQHIWFYDKDHIANHPGSTTVTKESKKKIKFEVSIDKYHILKVLVNGQQVYNSKIPSLFRNKVYLLAWGDHINCKVNFTNIQYSF